jgi:cytochrome c
VTRFSSTRRLAPLLLVFTLQGGRPADAADRAPDWGTVLPKANLAEGRRESSQCMQCHDLSQDRQNQFGPPLWGIVSRPRATAPGFQYSQGMRASHAPWTFDRLYAYLASPQAYVPGTPMSFPGIRNDRKRIDLIAYLRTLADNPAQLPQPRTSDRRK